MHEPSRQLMSFNVAGFQFWDGALGLGELKVGTLLELVPEPATRMTPRPLRCATMGPSSVTFHRTRTPCSR